RLSLIIHQRHMRPAVGLHFQRRPELASAIAQSDARRAVGLDDHFQTSGFSIVIAEDEHRRTIRRDADSDTGTLGEIEHCQTRATLRIRRKASPDLPGRIAEHESLGLDDICSARALFSLPHQETETECPTDEHQDDEPESAIVSLKSANS